MLHVNRLSFGVLEEIRSISLSVPRPSQPPVVLVGREQIFKKKINGKKKRRAFQKKVAHSLRCLSTVEIHRWPRMLHRHGLKKSALSETLRAPRPSHALSRSLSLSKCSFVQKRPGSELFEKKTTCTFPPSSLVSTPQLGLLQNNPSTCMEWHRVARVIAVLYHTASEQCVCLRLSRHSEQATQFGSYRKIKLIENRHAKGNLPPSTNHFPSGPRLH